MITPHFLDQFSLAQLFLVTLALMLLFIEFGFRIGRSKQSKAAKAQCSQVRAIMGAVLGLLAFVLAFAFATGQSHYEVRVQYMVEEARLARNIYFQAEFLPAPYADQARKIIRNYIGDRIQADQLARENRFTEILEITERSERMHQDLWRIAAINENLSDDSPGAGLGRDPFTELVSSLIDIHAQRLQAALMNRIPNVIWVALYLCALLSMLVVGYQAGLVGRRSPIATISLALAFSGIMMLITDLDRPLMSLFHMDNHIMVEIIQMMDAEQAALLDIVTGS